MIDLSKARILISNDDGIDAPGIAVLERIVRRWTDDVWVVAPVREQSGAGHSLTLRRPLRIMPRGERRFAVDGTPTDCAMLGIQEVLGERRPDLVVSGINRGGNLGEDITYSGTVAAAMEATLLGVPAIAFSQYFEDRRGIDFAPAEALTDRVTRSLLAGYWPENVLINVNFPADPPGKPETVEIVPTRQGKRKIGDHIARRHDPRGDPYYWIGASRGESSDDPGTDLAAVRAGKVSVTPLTLNFTDEATLKKLQAGS